MRVFKDELRQAITYPDQVPTMSSPSTSSTTTAAPKTFLNRLWRDLYGDDPVTGPGMAGPHHGDEGADRLGGIG